MREHPDETEHDRELSKSESRQENARRFPEGKRQGCDEQRTDGLRRVDRGNERRAAALPGTGAPAPTGRHRPRSPRWISDDEIDGSFERRKRIPIPELGRAGHQRQKQEAVKPIRRVRARVEGADVIACRSPCTVTAAQQSGCTIEPSALTVGAVTWEPDAAETR